MTATSARLSEVLRAKFLDDQDKTSTRLVEVRQELLLVGFEVTHTNYPFSQRSLRLSSQRPPRMIRASNQRRRLSACPTARWRSPSDPAPTPTLLPAEHRLFSRARGRCRLLRRPAPPYAPPCRRSVCARPASVRGWSRPSLPSCPGKG